METQTAETTASQQTQKYSPTETSIFRESLNPIVLRLSEIIDKSRRAKGWTIYDDDNQQVALNDWIEILNAARINGKHYPELYLRSAAVRSEFLQNGKQPPDITAELLVSQWAGLRQDIAHQTAYEQQKNAPADKRYLENYGKILCRMCLGTGFSLLKLGRHNGVDKCTHEESYQFTDGDEVVGGDEGIRIIERHLAEMGIAFHPEIKKVIFGNFGNR